MKIEQTSCLVIGGGFATQKQCQEICLSPRKNYGICLEGKCSSPWRICFPCLVEGKADSRDSWTVVEKGEDYCSSHIQKKNSPSKDLEGREFWKLDFEKPIQDLAETLIKREPERVTVADTVSFFVGVVEEAPLTAVKLLASSIGWGPLVEARAIKEFYEKTNIALGEIAFGLNKSEAWIKNRLRLLALSSNVQSNLRMGGVKEGGISVTIALRLASLPFEKQEEIVKTLIKEKKGFYSVIPYIQAVTKKLREEKRIRGNIRTRVHKRKRKRK